MSNKTKLFLAVAAGLAASSGFELPYLKSKEKKEKKCLTCDNTHFHNNSFCSPECCKEYKVKNK